jgi:hypothetical protein
LFHRAVLIADARFGRIVFAIVPDAFRPMLLVIATGERHRIFDESGLPRV